MTQHTHLLRPELQTCIHTGDMFTFIKHPFVNCMLFDHPIEIERLNTLYEESQQRFNEALDNGGVSEALAYIERPWRVSYLHDFVFKRKIVDTVIPFNELLGWVWTDTEFPHEQAEEWQALWNCKLLNSKWLMDDEERAFVDELPNKFTVYRGAKGRRIFAEHGFSWTLDKARAEWFASRLAASHEKPFVAEAVVDKRKGPKHCPVVYFNGRNEQEIVRI